MTLPMSWKGLVFQRNVRKTISNGGVCTLFEFISYILSVFLINDHDCNYRGGNFSESHANIQDDVEKLEKQEKQLDELIKKAGWFTTCLDYNLTKEFQIYIIYNNASNIVTTMINFQVTFNPSEMCGYSKKLLICVIFKFIYYNIFN